MRFALAFWFLALVSLAHLPARATPACAADLHLNELCAGPARDWNGDGAFSSRDDEWVEVVNAGLSPLDLAGFFITDGDSIPRFAFAGALAPGTHRVVFGSESVEWERAAGYPVFGFSLGNSGDQVMLWQVTAAETLLVDTYAYRSHEAAADRAVGRQPDASGGWTLFDGLNPYSGTTSPPGTGCMPTPGAANTCPSTPSRPTSWGELKTRYR
jgi:hypothetical protein